MSEELVSFELAKLLKEKGFNVRTLHYYFEDSEFRINTLSGTNGYYGDEYSFEYDEFLENWNDKFKTTKDGDRCFGCTQSKYLETYSAPTLSLVQKWLREEYNTYVGVSPIIYAGEEKAEGFQATLNNSTILYKSRFDSYEEALENGIVFYLKSLKDV